MYSISFDSIISSLYNLQNALLSKRFKFFDQIIFFKFTPIKASEPIFSIFPKLIDSNFLQLENAFSPISSIFFDKTMLVIFVLPSNAKPPILTTGMPSISSGKIISPLACHPLIKTASFLPLDSLIKY